MAALPVAVLAGDKKKSPLLPVIQDRVLSASSNSITISHSSLDYTRSNAKTPPVRKDRTVTYEVTQFTNVEVNGRRANPSDVRTGMAVSVSSSDPVGPDGQGGVATTIIAHDAPPPPKIDDPKKK